MRRRRGRTLWVQILWWELATLTLAIAVGFLLFSYQDRVQLDHQYELRAAAVAQTTAGVPTIVACLQDLTASCRTDVQAVAVRLQRETGAAYVVVIDRDRVRLSHPDPALIGQRVTEPLVAIDGRTHVGIDVGATGRSANGRAPVKDAAGAVVGEVSVGLTESSVTAALWDELPVYAGWSAVALLVGLCAAVVLARRLKRRTFGLELDEIAGLLREREATLHAIREGVVVLDRRGTVTMVNDEARRLLDLPHMEPGRTLDRLTSDGRLRDVLTGDVPGPDATVLTERFSLVVNRMPIVIAGHEHGAVITLRDRTEIVTLLQELDGVRRLSDTMRAQQHEFSNRLHTVAGLLELDLADEALDFVTDLRARSTDLADRVRTRISSPQLVGLLVGKAAAAGERGIELHVAETCAVVDPPDDVQSLTSIVGNLIDNALDAVGEGSPPGSARVVDVEIVQDDTSLRVVVSDTGPGLSAHDVGRIFVDGFSTKASPDGPRRGLGLAIVQRLVHAAHGRVDVREGPGGWFCVELPRVPTPRAHPVEVDA